MKAKYQKQSLAAEPHQNDKIDLNQNGFMKKEQKQSSSSTNSDEPIEPKKIKTTLDIYDQNIQIVRCVGEGAIYKLESTKIQTQKSFETLQEEERFKHKKIVAETLINRDYGLILFKEEAKIRNINIKIDKVLYKSMACGVAIETVRKIQHFLLYMCERKIHSVQHQQLRCIFSILLHFKLHFKEQQLQTFIDFICLTYNIREVIITEGRACRLYSAIQEILKQKIASKLAKPLYHQKLKLLRPALFKNIECQAIHKLNKCWDDRHEDEMVEFYKNDQRFANMRTYFRQIYPGIADYFTIASLKSQFYKILRAILKQIDLLLLKKGPKKFPELIKLHAQRTKTILRSPGGERLRLKMLQIYKKEEVSYLTLTGLINCINQFIIYRQNGKEKPIYRLSQSEFEQQQIDIVQSLGKNYSFNYYLELTGDSLNCQKIHPQY